MNGLAETYAYDTGDKLLSVTWAGGAKTYGYDAAGRTTSVTTSLYEGDGLRRVKITVSVRSTHVWDGSDYLGEYQ